MTNEFCDDKYKRCYKRRHTEATDRANERLKFKKYHRWGSKFHSQARRLKRDIRRRVMDTLYEKRVRHYCSRKPYARIPYWNRFRWHKGGKYRRRRTLVPKIPFLFRRLSGSRLKRNRALQKG